MEFVYTAYTHTSQTILWKVGTIWTALACFLSIVQEGDYAFQMYSVLLHGLQSCMEDEVVRARLVKAPHG